MKTKRKRPVLKWRREKTYWGHIHASGPFEIQEYNEPNGSFFRVFLIGCGNGWHDCESLDEAKTACERLAKSILRHCATGARDGK